jgi:hypothetical protein
MEHSERRDWCGIACEESQLGATSRAGRANTEDRFPDSHRLIRTKMGKANRLRQTIRTLL